MGKFLNGLLLGVGLGLLVAPKRGEEMRGLLGERLGQAKRSLPDGGQGLLRNRPSFLGPDRKIVKDVEEYYIPPTKKAEPASSSASNVGGTRPASTAPGVERSSNYASPTTTTATTSSTFSSSTPSSNPLPKNTSASSGIDAKNTSTGGDYKGTNSPRNDMGPTNPAPLTTSTSDLAGDITRTGSPVTENLRAGTQAADPTKTGPTLSENPRQGIPEHERPANSGTTQGTPRPTTTNAIPPRPTQPAPDPSRAHPTYEANRPFTNDPAKPAERPPLENPKQPPKPEKRDPNRP
ncbi:hypothetical protein [Tengunoibacter tsumagoiensis]|uniref:YtxH domain-containing protein n=1 Tax=Tengunoibacter tsumagoiensis TaxID=2014871 RepID=A0A402A3E3_9CHLR|nr:hypothetical protein [Tengunoibacter tsumagoiensis]GCE13556.1 hypothetical protein KTT_34150 [Tengunoibacter tsumagoiensis]